MFRIAQIILLLGLLLASCSPQEQTIPPIPEASPIPTVTPQPTHTLTPEPSPTATPMSLSGRVRAFMAGNIEFPSDLTGEQYSAFIKEMNVQRGAKPIYVELDGKTMYLSKETRKMETISGNYSANKALIDKNSFPLYAEVYHKEGQDLQYVHPDTGELLTLPKSADVDWTHVVNAENFSDGYMQLAPGEILTSLKEYVERNKNNGFIQVILLDKQPIFLTRIQGTYDNHPTLNTLLVKTNEEGKPIYAKRIFYGTISLGHTVMEENSSIFNRIRYSLINQSSQDLNELKSNNIYYASASQDQANIWEDQSRSNIDEVKNLALPSIAYKTGVYDLVSDEGNIVLIGGFLVLKN